MTFTTTTITTTTITATKNEGSCVTSHDVVLCSKTASSKIKMNPKRMLFPKIKMTPNMRRSNPTGSFRLASY